MGLEEVVGQLLVGPAGPVQALAGGPLDDPAAQLVGQRRGDLARLALGLAGLEAAEAAGAVGVEPAGDGPAVEPQVGGDVLACPAAVGHEDDLEAVAQFAVVGGAEEGVEAVGLWRWELNTDQGIVPFQNGSARFQLDDGTASMGSCMRNGF